MQLLDTSFFARGEEEEEDQLLDTSFLSAVEPEDPTLDHDGKPWPVASSVEPTVWDNIQDFFTGGEKHRARASNELQARKIAKRDGIEIEEVYESVGGARPMLNPEGRAPVRALAEGGALVVDQLTGLDIPKGVANTILRTIRGGDEDVDDSGWIDRAIAGTDKEFDPDDDPNYQAFQGLGKNLGYSITTMTAGTAAYIAGSAASTPIGGTIAAGAASGAVAFRGSKDEYLSRAREAMDAYFMQTHERKMNQDEWDRVYGDFNTLANKYGAWEAIPEALGNMVFIRAFAMPLKGAAPSAIQAFKIKANEVAARTAQVLATENITEIATALGQNAAEREGGLTDRELSLSAAVRETVIPTTLLTTLMGGAGTVAKTTYNKLKPTKTIEQKAAEASAPPSPSTDLDQVAQDIQAQVEASDIKTDPPGLVGSEMNMDVPNLDAPIEFDAADDFSMTDEDASVLFSEIMGDAEGRFADENIPTDPPGAAPAAEKVLKPVEEAPLADAVGIDPMVIAADPVVDAEVRPGMDPQTKVISDHQVVGQEVTITDAFKGPEDIVGKTATITGKMLGYPVAHIQMEDGTTLDVPISVLANNAPTKQDALKAKAQGKPKAEPVAIDSRMTTGLSQDDFYKAIDAAPKDAFTGTRTEDWGTTRGQGKRSGGQVMGAMGDVTLQGKKTYTSLIQNLPDYDDVKLEVGGLEKADQARYAQTRAAGFDHNTAMLAAYPDVDDATAYKRSQELESITAKPTTKEGNEVNVNIPSTGSTVQAKVAVVEAADLIASNDDAGNVNARYPAELQPRNRKKGSSLLQVQKIAKNLKPELLVDNGQSNGGSPIIGPEGVIESGNGRTLAIMAAYKAGDADGYREYITAQAASQGLSGADIESMENPVMVRIRQGEMDMNHRAEFARQSNQSGLAPMTPVENAQADAVRITDDDMTMFMPDSSGNVLAASNQEFLKRFGDRLGDLEVGGLSTPDGRWTKQMADRVTAAVFYKAYGDEKLLALAAEEADPDIKNILNGLNQAAPAFARARSITEDLGELDIITDIVGAIDLVRKAKADSTSVEQLVAQAGLFGDVDPVVGKIGQFLESSARSSKRIGMGLSGMANFLEKELNNLNQESLFNLDPATKADLVEAANKQIKEIYGDDTQTIDLFAESPATQSQDQQGAGQRIDQPGSRDRQPGEGQGAETEAARPEVLKPATTENIAAIENQGTDYVPESTVKAYKLFTRKKGDLNTLYPLFVDADIAVPIGEWTLAHQGEKQGDKVKSRIGHLANRPGWHSGALPVAPQIGKKDAGQKSPNWRAGRQIWAEVEIPADIDWQTEANNRAETTKAGKPLPRTAHITDQIPAGGYYKYKTNPNQPGEWMISGAIKVNRILTDAEVADINSQDLQDLPRKMDDQGNQIWEPAAMYELDGRSTAAQVREDTGGHAKAGGEYGLNGEFYQGGQFMPASARTKKGAYKYEPSSTGGSGMQLVEPGVFARPPEGAMAIFGSTRNFMFIENGTAKLIDNDLAMSNYGGKTKFQKLRALYNKGWRFIDNETGLPVPHEAMPEPEPVVHPSYKIPPSQGEDVYNVEEQAIQYDLFNAPEFTQDESKAQAADIFNIEYIQREVGQLSVGTTNIQTHGDAAHVMAPIRKHAQETMMILVTDQAGEILNVIRHTKGTKDGASAYPTDIIGAIAGTEGAANYWLAHNHPSGIHTPSQADIGISKQIKALTDGMGINYSGHVIIGDGYTYMDTDTDVRTPFRQIPPMARNKKVSVTERLMKRRSKKPLPGTDHTPALTSPMMSERYVQDLETDTGVLLMNNRNVPIGVIAMTRAEMGYLRDGTQVNRILKALNTSNAAAGIIFAKSPGDASVADSQARNDLLNIGNFLARLKDGFRVLDILSPRTDGTLDSTAQTGEGVGTANNIFFRRGGEYSEMEGRELTYEVEVESTGETHTMTIDAAQAMRDIDTRLEALEELKRCI